jgi:UDP-glucose 4-epimerase
LVKLQSSGRILVTGGFGFLGRAVACKFKKLGYRVVGIGHGKWGLYELQKNGFDIWHEANVDLKGLTTINEKFDIVVHCAGNGSVGYSVLNPLQDFYKTVQTTVELLDYLRLSNPGALVVYPSSAGVYGAKEDAPIRESDPLNPISPYGYHKKIAEDLLKSYSDNYGIRVALVRYFSIYGPGLSKQLLWDAATKLLLPGSKGAEFWGTGNETRDWIYVEDAAELIASIANTPESFLMVNGASGYRVTIREVLNLLREELRVDSEIIFNNETRIGDPLFYHADIGQALELGWKPVVSLREGVKAYVKWLRERES